MASLLADARFSVSLKILELSQAALGVSSGFLGTSKERFSNQRSFCQGLSGDSSDCSILGGASHRPARHGIAPCGTVTWAESSQCPWVSEVVITVSL